MKTAAALANIKKFVAGSLTLDTHSYSARKVADHYEIERNHGRDGATVRVETAEDMYQTMCMLSSTREVHQGVQNILNVYG